MNNIRAGGHGGGPPMVGKETEKTKDFKGTVRKLLQYLRPFYGNLSTVFIFAVLSTIFSIFGPKIMGMAVDKLFEGVMAKIHNLSGASIDFRYISKILLFLLAIYLFSALFSYLQGYIMAGVSQKIVQKMRDDVSRKLHHLPLNFFDTKTHGEILSRITNDIDTINSSFQQSLTQLLTSIVSLIGMTIIMLTISPKLTLVTFVTLPMSFIITAFIAKKSQKFFVGQQRELGELNGYVEEMYSGHNVVKSYNYEQKSIEEFNKTNDRLYKHGWKAQFASSVVFPILNFVGNVTYVGICVLGGYLTATGSITLGTVQAFMSYARQFNQPISQVANIVNVLQSTVAAAERFFEIMEEKEEIPDPANPKIIENPQGDVKFDQISFRYVPEKPLIENLSIDVKHGRIIAIVGSTGAGKTTLVNLLMRFYELNEGSISIDGVKTTDMKRRDLHNLFGMVLQDAWLFKGTIRENIAYGKRNATETEIIQAAKTALADNFIRTFPEGYDTAINEDASNISQGQKQLITIARAVLANPKMLILDEATSSVDTRTEILIQKAMNSLMQGRTSFVIAHRLSTIRDADSIIVMENGSIVEQGNHNELLAKKGIYANLYDSQFA